MTARGDSVTTSGWRVASASRRGSSHHGATPNQDAVRTDLVVDARDRPVWLAAVADGHGGPRYVRSDIGSRAAADVAVEHLARLISGSHGDIDPDLLLRREVPAIVAAWLHRVGEHHQGHPFTPEESARSGDPRLDDHPAIAYGTTLIIAVVGEHGLGVAQIGDGDVLIRTNGFATRPVPGDSRLVAGETTSLCLDTAVTDFRFASLPDSADPDLVMLATDGYGNSFADTDWWHDLIGDLTGFVAAHGFDELEARFPAWLEESAQVGGDDVTAVVVVRQPLVVVPGSEPESERPALPAVSPDLPPPSARVRTLPLDEEPAAPATRRRTSRLVALVLGLVVLLVIGVTTAVVLGTRDGSAPQQPQPGLSESPTPGVETPPEGGQSGTGGPAGEPGRPPAGDPRKPSRVGSGQEPPPDGGEIEGNAP